jgi:glycosyltransferase involved in cell wall biosynthesis
MQIGFDAKRYFHNRTGLGNYSRDLINTLIHQHPEDRFFLYDKHPEIEHLPQHVVAVPPLNGGFLWRERGIQTEIKRYQLDVFHGLSNELPFGKWPDRVKKIVSIHDVIFKHYPEHYAFLDRSIYHYKTRHAIAVADAIIATSNATAHDLINLYQAPVDKVKVVYQTCGEQHRVTYSLSAIQALQAKYRLPEQFIVYVSSFQTRKNHLTLLKAYAAVSGKLPPLVLAGKSGDTLNDVKRFVQEHQLSNRVQILTEVDNAELPLLYRAASWFVYPSMIEGFGIPLIEAAHAALPMAVNDIPVFKELASDDAILFNASEVDAFSEALLSLTQRGKIDYTDMLKAFDPLVSAEAVYALYK